MSFESLLGNEQLKSELSRSLQSGHFAHCYLISGPRGSGKHTLARLLAAGILCREGRNRPCLRCGPCRKVMENLHPDFITVDDYEHKTVTVEVIRNARADVYIQPNESDHKIYLFPRAQDIRTEGQNALLKILEEPPSYAVFLLLTDNPEKLLPTVRSRCRELKLLSLPQDVLLSRLRRDFPQAEDADLLGAIRRSGGFLGQAKELLESGAAVSEQTEGFFRAFLTRDELALVTTLVPMEKWKREQLIPELNAWIAILEEALVCRAGGTALSPLARSCAQQRSSQDIYAAVTALKKAVAYAQGNVSVGAICGDLQFVLRAN